MEYLDISALRDRIHAAGEAWAIAHAQRLLKLIEQIGEGLNYDLQSLLWAAYLHDWGAFQNYYQSDCDHAALSRQIAETEILPWVDLPIQTKAIILEAIELHDYRDQRPAESKEVLLLREADFLDFLGVIGMARDFAWGPNDLAICTRRILAKRAAIQGRFSLPKAQEMAQIRLERMAQALDWLDEESFGIL